MSDSNKMPMNPENCQGHQIRLDTASKIKKIQQEPRRIIDAHKKIYLKKGGQHGSEIMLIDLNDIVRKTDEWKDTERSSDNDPKVGRVQGSSKLDGPEI